MNASSGFTGSDKVLVSVAKQNIIPKGYYLHKFSFLNYQPCTIKINESDPIYLAQGQGFGTDEHDNKVYSFEVIEEGINFNWVGAYRYVTLPK